MRSSGRQYFNKAVRSYDEKPRRLWIFDYPAQAALCGVQIWWTAETNDAFAQLEIGHENALKEYNKKQVILTSFHYCFIVYILINLFVFSPTMLNAHIYIYFFISL